MFLHELVHSLYRTAMDYGNREADLAASFVAHLHKANILTTAAIRLGMCKLIERMDDIALDVPNAPRLLVRWLIDAVESGYPPH